MHRTTNFKNIRSNMAFLVGLFAAAGIAMAVDKAPIGNVERLGTHPNSSAAMKAIAIARKPSLSSEEKAAAALAWRYIENNTQPETGLVNSVDGFSSTTLWDLGSYLFALTAARKLDVISEATFKQRSLRVLAALKQLPLVDGLLPNKVFDTRTLLMTDYQNNLVSDGIGWSALDLGRLLLGLENLSRADPALAENIASVTQTWRLGAMVQSGYLVGSTRDDNGNIAYLQEGRLGYEQYAARSATMSGLDAIGALTAFDKLQWRRIAGVDVAIDRRRYQDYDAITPILSEPYFLMAFEMGLDTENTLLAHQLYKAQENRFLRTGLRTSVSEDHIDQAPYFLYGTVFGNGKDWAVIAEDGREYPELRTISVKSAFAWNALYSTDYTRETLDSLTDLAIPDRGWAAGRYEASGAVNSALTLNTNAIVLEALHYSVFGPFLNP